MLAYLSTSLPDDDDDVDDDATSSVFYSYVNLLFLQ
jgi:hypothetical protein